MKTPYAIGAVITAVVITVAIEETRISSLRRELERPVASAPVRAATPTAPAPEGGATESETPGHTATTPKAKPANSPKPPATEGESLAKTTRRMWDNPAGRSMMSQGVKIAVSMMYDDFIKGLNLTPEEADHFKELLGKEMSLQQEAGMKMMGASADERTALIAEMQRAGAEQSEAIKTFLNDEEDFQGYTAYKDRLPERQQLDGIRATMSGKGVPLDAATETRLLETMFKVRTETKAPDLTGPGALEEMAKGNIVESFERSWQSQQDTLRTGTAEFLSPAQQAAFEEYQKNMKEMQLMGLKMAEKMMNEGKSGSP
jgi:hypothetical protein